MHENIPIRTVRGIDPAAPEIAYVGDHRGHEERLRQLCGPGRHLRWKGAATRAPWTLFTDPRSAVVLLDRTMADPPTMARAIRARLPTVVIFLLVCRSDRLEPAEWTALRDTVEGAVSCASLAELCARTLAIAADVSPVLRPVPVPASPAAAAGLTQAEVEVLACAADGLTAQETAARLGTGVSAGRALMRSARRRLNARTRAEAVAKALRNGLLH